MKHAILGLAAAAAILLSTGLASAETILRLGHNNPPSHPWHIAALELAAKVSERTGGNVKIEVYPSAQLGDERELGEGLQVGTVSLAMAQTAMFGAFLPQLSALEGGYLFRDRAHFDATLSGQVGTDLSEMLSSAVGIHLSGWHFAGERILTTTDKLVSTPADMAGLKVRVPRLDNYIATFSALGAEPVPVAYGETYLALQTGVVDGMEVPIPSIHSMKFNEVQKYLNYIGHIYGVGVVGYSDAALAQLSEADRAVVIEELRNIGPRISELFDQQTEELLPEVLTTMEENKVDREVFRTYALEHGLSDWFKSTLGEELYQTIQDVQ